ncbi:MAG TPA: glycerol-3-phosphate dehydrogenase/oxidase [Nitrospirota bacterium]|nr:glycerol-3-phosphate dehydrogenase/oxidase [Nitrospirota bacterium]
MPSDKKTEFDIIVVGGGITGAGVARDAALRGLSCLLVEKGDFASGTTSKSTRLIHGGLRYLANFEVDLVAESLRERAVLRKQAPYLIHPVPILIPIYRDDLHGRTVISIGIHLYDLLSHERDIPHYFTSNREKTLKFEPRLRQEGLQGSALFFDHQIRMPERLVIENILAARQAGAVTLNHTLAEKIEELPDRVAVSTRDAFSGAQGTYRARVLINAAGPWIDRVRARGGLVSTSVIHPTKGIHLVMPRLSTQALFVTSRDGRMFFIIPLGDYSLIGTTDTNYDGDLDHVHADNADIDYLLNESRRVLPGLGINRQSIFHTYAGIRPLAFSGPHTSKISRKHRILREGRAGRIITIAGGKLTTYRHMAEDVVNAACRVLGIKTPCTTSRTPLPGDIGAEYEVYLKQGVRELSVKYKTAEALVRHLVDCYGSRAANVLEIVKENPAMGEAISPECADIGAQIEFSIKEEQGRTLEDILLRRMAIGMSRSRGLDQIDRVASVAATHLRWSKDERQHAVDLYREALKKETACLNTD